jgi:L-lactate dehydrogenase
MVKAAPVTPILVLTDPPDPLVDVARHYAGHVYVFATSTALDSLRFKTRLGGHLSVNLASIHAHVLGEHGISSVFLLSEPRSSRSGPRGAPRRHAGA